MSYNMYNPYSSSYSGRYSSSASNPLYGGSTGGTLYGGCNSNTSVGSGGSDRHSRGLHSSASYSLGGASSYGSGSGRVGSGYSSRSSSTSSLSGLPDVCILFMEPLCCCGDWGGMWSRTDIEMQLV